MYPNPRRPSDGALDELVYGFLLFGRLVIVLSIWAVVLIAGGLVVLSVFSASTPSGGQGAGAVLPAMATSQPPRSTPRPTPAARTPSPTPVPTVAPTRPPVRGGARLTFAGKYKGTTRKLVHLKCRPNDLTVVVKLGKKYLRVELEDILRNINGYNSGHLYDHGKTRPESFDFGGSWVGDWFLDGTSTTRGKRTTLDRLQFKHPIYEERTVATVSGTITCP